MALPINSGEFDAIARSPIMVTIIMKPPAIRPPSPIWIEPPGIIVIIGIGVDIVIVRFIPKINLLAQNKRIMVIHFPEGFDLFSQDFTAYGDFPAFPEDIRIQILVRSDQKPPL